MNSIIFPKIIDIHLNFNLCVFFYILHYHIIRNLKWQYIETHLLSSEMFWFFFLKQKVKIADALLSDVWRPRCSWPGKIISAPNLGLKKKKTQKVDSTNKLYKAQF